MNSPTTSTASIEKDLDAEIRKIQGEIRSLQSHRHILTSSLLSSEPLQSRLQHLQSSATGRSPGTAADGDPNRISDSNPDTPDISPLAAAASRHSSCNHHRIAFTATAFQYNDHSPGLDDDRHNPDRDIRNALTNRGKKNDHDNQHPLSHHPDQNRHGQSRLLGIRLDIGGRKGKFSRPYYLILKKVAAGNGESGKRVKIHRHTIPGFISVRDLERVYLPVPVREQNVEGEAEADDVLKPWKKQKQGGAKKQDLRGLVRELRKELVAWQLRRDVLDLLRERLGFVREGEEVISDGGGELAERLGIVSLTAMGLDARYFRIQWADGRIGRLRISNTGAVMRAVVIKDSGRDKLTEMAIMGGDARVEGLLERLMGLTTSSED